MKRPSIRVTSVVTLLITAAASAAPFSISRWTIDSGGGTSAGGRFTVSGSIGQSETGATSSGGRFSVVNGFLPAVQAVQTGGLPRLEIQLTGRNEVTATWIDDGVPVTLEESSDMKAGSWETSLLPITSSGNLRKVTVTKTKSVFLRLRRGDQ